MQVSVMLLSFSLLLSVSMAAKSSKRKNVWSRNRKESELKRRRGNNQRAAIQSQENFLDEVDIQDNANVPDEQRLLAQILHNYEPSARPVINASHTVTIKFGLTFVRIFDMDEVNQVLTCNVWLEKEWDDERLRWDPNDYNGLKVMRMPCHRIWLPDIVLYNSADDFTEGFMQSKAMVTHEGNVFWAPPAKLRSSCKIDITFFPFDDQLCTMKFGSWTYDGFQVDMTNRSANVDLANYVFSGEWELLDISVVRNEVYYLCCKEPFPDVTFKVLMRRRTLYYLFNIIFPCLWLTVLSLLCFWLPPDSGEKITLGITVLLAYSVFMLLIAESMPATSEFVPLIGIYLTVTMAMTSLSIVLTVFILQVHHSGPNQSPVPGWLRRLVIHRIASMLCMRNHIKRYYGFSREGRTMTVHDKRKISRDAFVTTFLDNTEHDDKVNCNGKVQSDIHTPLTVCLEPPVDQVRNHLKILMSKHDEEDNFEDIVNEWRLVAHVLDKLMFWIFTIGSTVSTVAILVLKPLFKPELV